MRYSVPTEHASGDVDCAVCSFDDPTIKMCCIATKGAVVHSDMGM